jgi:hypothetical protein
MKPGISIQRFFGFTEERRLSAKEILIAGHWRRKVITTSTKRLTLLVLLCLHQQIKKLRLPSHHLS